MEIRKVVIVESGGQRKRVIETGAETLGQLKEDLSANGIDYEGKTFFEGLSKTELMHDDSILPKNIERNGSITNNLVFMLTTPQKKIKSGSMSRQEAYAKIKELGLQETCMKKYGKNFTMCKTDELISLINGAVQEAVDTPERGFYERPVAKEPSAEELSDVMVEKESSESKAIKKLLDILYDNGIIDSEEADIVLSILSKEEGNSMSGSPYTDSEIDDMFRDCQY